MKNDYQSQFSKKQMLVLAFPYLQEQYDAIIGDGSIRSGKTVSMSLAFILWSMSEFNGKNFGICGKTVGSVERNVIKEIMKIQYLQNNFTMKYHRTAGMLTIARGKKMNYYYIFGGKDESSYQLIQGITLAGVLLDEVALMPRSFVEQAIGRCSVDGSKYFFNCNPESPEHWFLKEWIEKAEDKNALHLHFTMEDNPSLSEKVKERYMKSYSGVFYQRYILGKWVRAEGLIYSEFASNTDDYLIDQVPDDLIAINVGMDFGGNKSKHTMVCTGFTRGFKQVVVLENEMVETNLTPTQLEQRYLEFIKMCYNKYRMTINSYLDSAEQVLIKGIRIANSRAALPNNVFNARKGEILNRIIFTQRLMGLGRFKIMKHCKQVISALQNAVWDSKHTDTRLDDGTSDIDTLDALEYSMESYMDVLIKVKGE